MKQFLFYLSCLLFITACATRHQAYEGPPRSEPEIVTVDNTSSFAFWTLVQIASVDDDRHRDGRPISGYSVLPGSHWYQVAIIRRSKAAMFFGRDSFNTEVICGFKLEADAGEQYQLIDIDNGRVVPENERNMYKATVIAERKVANNAPEVFRIDSECISLESFHFGWSNPSYKYDLYSKGGLLCREKSDCLNEQAVCTHETGFIYGICKKP